VRPLLVKGRGNYVSVRRLKLASQRQDRLFGDPAARRSLHVIEDWAYTTGDGTTSTLPPLERPGVWDKVQSDVGNCMGRKCPEYSRCFYQRERAKLERANLLVCNHALFFSDLALRAQEAGFLPAYQHVILDEAHMVEEVAAEHFGVKLAQGRVQHLLSGLYQPRTGKGFLAGLGLMSGEAEGVERAMRLVEQASAASRGFFDSLLELVSPRGSGSSPFHPGPRAEFEGRSVRLREAGAVANVVTPVFRELSLRLAGLKEAVTQDADRYELNAYSQRAGLIAADAEALVSQTMPGYAYWVEVTGGTWGSGGSWDEGGGARRVEIACAPVDVAPMLRERLFRQEHSVVLTSATLATRTAREDETGESAETAFAHAMSRLGCEGAGALQLGSPFDYARQVELYVEGGSEGGGGVPGLSSLSGAILRHVKATGGGAFVLFTSFAALNRCASELAGPLAALGLPLLAQGRDGSRGEILRRFRENDRSVLLGAASFWQGVDVQGRGLRNVIITKLPFEPPDRPLTQARYEMIESRGGNAFMEDSLPRAIIRFKQGFGRLIRSKTDHGRVVILDERVRTARYGRMFLAALPAGVRARGAEGV
jgi:ATP-dependent DNA helicase DinG